MDVGPHVCHNLVNLDRLATQHSCNSVRCGGTPRKTVMAEAGDALGPRSTQDTPRDNGAELITS
jgi:hypothetical protein